MSEPYARKYFGTPGRRLSRTAGQSGGLLTQTRHASLATLSSEVPAYER